VSAGAPRPELSIIIPAFNEARRLPESIARLQSYLQKQPFMSEVIVVDDGSTDSTSAVVRSWMGRWHALRLIQAPHKGKGAAVRAGALAAQGAWVYLADADFSVPIEEMARFLKEPPPREELRIGSREAPGAHRYGEPCFRHVMGRVFNLVVRALVVPGISDTQCGFKLLRREVARDLFLHQTIPGWTFDVELLYIAQSRGYSIREIPVPWYYRVGSKVNPARDTFGMLRDLIAIRGNALRGRYQRRVVPHPTFAPESEVIAGFEIEAPNSAASMPD
jgi:dolichyl-phosphate beta-glucosyltransferase